MNGDKQERRYGDEAAEINNLNSTTTHTSIPLRARPHHDERPRAHLHCFNHVKHEPLHQYRDNRLHICHRKLMPDVTTLPPKENHHLLPQRRALELARGAGLRVQAT